MFAYFFASYLCMVSLYRIINFEKYLLTSEARFYLSRECLSSLTDHDQELMGSCRTNSDREQTVPKLENTSSIQKRAPHLL